MPELPEMENYKRLLQERLAGRVITGVQVEREKSINVPPALFERSLIGTSVQRMERRAKHLLFHLSSSQVLVLHLMLGGILFLGTAEEKPERTVQVTLSFEALRLYFIGLRLGYLHLYGEREAEAFLSKLGPEPMEPEFTAGRFAGLLRQHKGALKSVLVDQSVMSGIGNCYSDEICFEAGLLPSRRCQQLSEEELERLFHAMRHVLSEATRYGGYMDMPLFPGDRLTGGYDSRCKVYDREGEPCVRCGRLLERSDVSSKKSFCCLNCQR
ncbi:endonuclease VIII [Paenibacillus doosanensis]|uniref:Formamidopyrimidine-DNA glycosylase n=1 Tax=Paenibacillus konkukensis TaxID=2020716 RepID=A0ABY4RGR0_9BACL|nr:MULTISPECIES: DNA-formamidopyrimidine glycosylase family protein [Paenibacillus]MCS7461141.1 endonuclease VIII [Paenibacillus doosanensis]UQZ81639.1 Formamidopyrimidine-DNA glycosylase [Paenibacillus konkukensis]